MLKVVENPRAQQIKHIEYIEALMDRKRKKKS